MAFRTSYNVNFAYIICIKILLSPKFLVVLYSIQVVCKFLFYYCGQKIIFNSNFARLKFRATYFFHDLAALLITSGPNFMSMKEFFLTIRTSSNASLRGMRLGFMLTTLKQPTNQANILLKARPDQKEHVKKKKKSRS